MFAYAIGVMLYMQRRKGGTYDWHDRLHEKQGNAATRHDATKRRNAPDFWTLCPEVDRVWGNPNKQFFTGRAVKNLQGWPNVAILALLAISGKEENGINGVLVKYYNKRYTKPENIHAKIARYLGKRNDMPCNEMRFQSLYIRGR